MASTSETGHAKNVANFEDFISFVTAYGAPYNPSKASIKLVNLNAIFTQAKTDITNVMNKTVAFNNFSNVRVILFEPLQKLSTRLVQALASTDASKELINDAKSVNRKIQGKRAKAIEIATDPNAPAPNTISASQLSYDQLIEHFSKLIEILKSEPTYAPNETELKITTLVAQLASLKTANTNVTNAYTAISNARIARDKTLYKEKTGMYDVTLDVKNYVKSLFGISSPEFKQLSKIKFSKPKTA
jgi:hypothetical protein